MHNFRHEAEEFEQTFGPQIQDIIDNYIKQRQSGVIINPEWIKRTDILVGGITGIHLEDHYLKYQKRHPKPLWTRILHFIRRIIKS